MVSHDILIVGGGLAGLAAALTSDPKLKVAVLSKVHPVRSHSISAQGGINAALANNPNAKDDTWEKHAFDTIKGSDYLADQDAVELMCKLAIPLMYELDHMGVPFSRFPGGVIAQRPFGGALYIVGDIPGADSLPGADRLKYRLWVRELPGGSWQPIANDFGVFNGSGLWLM